MSKNPPNKTTSDKKEHKLGVWSATAICGNDITSSCLYVSALALALAGPWAPLSLLLVAGLLWLCRGIYAEVVGALPLNGGAYNALLNTTSKFKASLAACLTILSYLATAVISSTEAVHYGIKAFEQLSHITVPHTAIFFNTDIVFWITAGLLAFFAFLTIQGIGESAKVALGIFIFHIFMLSLLLVAGGIWIATHGVDRLYTNLTLPPPQPSTYPLFFGFCVSLLGISGFESSANFVEEQKPGVFPKTLRNMWIAVTFFNPTICLLALCLIDLPTVSDPKVQTALLANMGEEAAGKWLSILISIDAALVLSGAVLTSFIGTTGLVHRMTLDRCLPQFLLKEGKRKTFYRIIVSFFLLSTLLLYIVEGELKALAIVYTISFLSVMILFATGNMLLKLYRNKLPRETKVSWITLAIAVIAMSVGLIGNIVLKLQYAKVFAAYFIVAVLIVIIMLERIAILKIGIYIIRSITRTIVTVAQGYTRSMEAKIDDINSQTVVFFTRGDNIAHLNEAMQYVKNNEHTNNLKVVMVVRNENEVPERLPQDLQFLDEAYPEIKIDFVVQRGTFSPQLLKELSEKWEIPLNFMFIGSPGDHFPHQLSELGGIRLII